MAYVTTEVEVEVDLDEFDDETLIDEIESRGYVVDPEVSESSINEECRDLIRTIYEKRRTGKDYQGDLDELFYNVLGKCI